MNKYKVQGDIIEADYIKVLTNAIVFYKYNQNIVAVRPICAVTKVSI